MTTQEYLNALVAQKRKMSFSNSDQLTLGQLIEKLKAVSVSEKDKVVVFDFGSAVPTKMDSWRGAYSELALGYRLTGYDSDSNNQGEVFLKPFIAELENMVGKSFEGWKGGDFTMDEETPVWVANPGNADHSGLIDVLDNGYNVILITGYCEY